MAEATAPTPALANRVGAPANRVDAPANRVDALATRVDAPARGGYARRDVDLSELLAGGQVAELQLALPFGALFSALLPNRAFRVRQLQLDYVQPERLGERATYSAQVGEALEGGRAIELRLLVARGAWLCVRGQAVLELQVAPDAAGSSAPGNTIQRNGHG